MVDNAKQMREFCQKWIIDSQAREINDPQVLKNILVLLDQMHKRLTLLEGEDLRSLEDITL